MERQRLFWDVPLAGVRAHSIESFRNTVFSSLVERLSQAGKKVLVLSYHNVAPGALLFSDFRFKIRTGREMCSRHKFYPEGFDCHARCAPREEFLESGIRQILNFSLYGSFSSSRRSE